jgi:transcriptional regulator with XRE-family HTH domain
MFMENEQRRKELAHFLRTRRERLSPEFFHLPEGAKRRRTPGLRREELASLAGVSLTWYTKLEQAQDIQASVQVLESLAQALKLTAEERTHLFVLAREQFPLPWQRHTVSISEDLQGMIDALNPYPSFVVNERWDVVGWNRAAALVFFDYERLSQWERNLVWIMFTQPEQRSLYADWTCWAQQTLALFRATSVRSEDTSWFCERRDQLMQISPEFRDWWQWHDIRETQTSHKELHHPVVDTLMLRSTSLLASNDPNLKIFIYTPLPHTGTEQKLHQLMSLVANEF